MGFVAEAFHRQRNIKHTYNRIAYGDKSRVYGAVFWGEGQTSTIVRRGHAD